MTFDDNVIIGKTIKDPDKLIKKLMTRKHVPGCFLVCVNVAGTGLEIYPTVLLKESRIKEKPLKVVAVFHKKDEAMEFIRRLCETALSKFGECDLLKALPYYDGEVS